MEGRDRTPPRTPTRNLARFAWLTLGVNLAVILWGAVVRATGSGAGCGSHWPLCDGEVVPRSPSAEQLVEYSHRLTSGLALVMVAVLCVWALRRVEGRHPVRAAAVASLILILVEAAIGAGLVLLELVADDASAARGFTMSAHLVNTFLLLAALTLTAYHAGGGPPVQLRGRPWGRLALALAATLLVGVSGAVAALGDTLFPAASHAEGWRQSLSSTSHLLLQLRLLHPVVAVAAGLFLLHLAAAVRRDHPGARRAALWLAVLVVVQLAAGLVNYVLLAPVWMQVVHLLLADLLWIALVLVAARALART